MNARTSAVRAAIVRAERALPIRPFGLDMRARMLDWSLPGGQDHYLKAISELVAGGGFTGENVTEISRQVDTHFPVAH
jgi:hypothetical protein